MSGEPRAPYQTGALVPAVNSEDFRGRRKCSRLGQLLVALPQRGRLRHFERSAAAVGPHFCQRRLAPSAREGMLTGCAPEPPIVPPNMLLTDPAELR